jgi:uncharacterized protein
MTIFKGTIPEDQDDDTVLSVAVAGNSDYLVKGDLHLLKLREFKRIKIVKVSEMLDHIR